MLDPLIKIKLDSQKKNGTDAFIRICREIWRLPYAGFFQLKLSRGLIDVNLHHLLISSTLASNTYIRKFFAGTFVQYNGQYSAPNKLNHIT